jgi:hypothetical protein
MFLRNDKKKIIYIEKEKFHNDVDFYNYLWKIKYSINMKDLKNENIKNDIINNLLQKY